MRRCNLLTVDETGPDRVCNEEQLTTEARYMRMWKKSDVTPPVSNTPHVVKSVSALADAHDHGL